MADQHQLPWRAQSYQTAPRLHLLLITGLVKSGYCLTVTVLSQVLALAKRVRIISEFRAHIWRLEEKNITTLGTWICSHAELEPNELADKHAKPAAEEARECSRQSSTSLSEAKSAVKLMTLTKWQRGWHKSEKGQHLYSLLPSVKRSSFKSIHNRTAERKINRLRLGHTNLKADLAHKKIIENPMSKCELKRMPHKLYRAHVCAKRGSIPS